MESSALITHAIDRFVIHFFASCGLVLGITFVLRMIQRRFSFEWFPVFWQTQVFAAAIIVFAGSTLREAFDVSQGQPLFKAVTDYISWMSGCGVSAWGLIRLVKDTTK